MPSDTKTCRLAIAGASSLLGREVKQMLEEGRFAAADVRLVDEEIAAGTLTELAGEPAVIQAADDDSFEGAQLVFFTGSAELARKRADSALRAGASVIDLSGGLADSPAAKLWIPSLDAMMPPAVRAEAKQGGVFLSPSTPAIIACTISAALPAVKAERLTFVFFQPVSESGQAGIEELESQTAKLLAFQPIGDEVFGTQVAFNLMDRFAGPNSGTLAAVRQRVSREAHSFLNGRGVVPAIQIVHVPAFYSHAFTTYVELSGAPDASALAQALEKAGIRIAKPDEPTVSNLSVAGENTISMNFPARDSSAGGFWLWGAADNFRLAALNAVRIAEKLV
jgi:aspartate-semialdehyde dehydrogenase